MEEPSDSSRHSRPASARHNTSSEVHRGATEHGGRSNIASATVSGSMNSGAANGVQDNASSTRRDRALKESVDSK